MPAPPKPRVDASPLCRACAVAAVWALLVGPALGQPASLCRHGPAADRPDSLPTDRLLLSLLVQEQALLENYGNEHPQVISVRARIAVVRDYLARHPVPVKPSQAPPPAAPMPKPSTFASEIVQTVHLQPIVPEAKPKGPHYDNGAWHGVRADRAKPQSEAPVADSSFRGRTPPARPDTNALPWIGLSSAFVLGLLFHVAALRLVLRRFGASPFRIELVGERAKGVSPLLDESIADCSNRGLTPPARPALDLAPPPVGKLQQKEEARKQQEAAIFRQIAEQNLHLRAQLRASTV